jgi:prephenate dehydratase/prephenate dehydrogenase
MSHSRHVSIHHLGPAGTFSERAAKALGARLPSWTTVPEANATAVAAAARHPGSLGVLAYYNLLEGLVQENIDLIDEQRLHVLDAMRLPIRFAAGSIDGTNTHGVVVSHAKALAQCSDFIRRFMPGAEVRPTASTADAARLAADGGLVAIAEVTALEANGLRVFARDVGNRPFERTNFTDFLVVAAEGGLFPEMGAAVPSRTLIAITPQIDRAGLLADILGQFAFAGLNLAKIHSRPTLHAPQIAIEPQTFYLEIMGGPADPSLQRCLDALSWRLGDGGERSAVRVLGTWSDLEAPVPEAPNQTLAALDPCLVVGCHGGFGRALSRMLRAQGITVYGADVHPTAPPDVTHYWHASGPQLPPEALEHVRWVLLCLPEKATVDTVPRLTALSATQLVSDVTSVKSRLAEVVRSSELKCQWLSIHPMFAPSLPLRGRNICLVTLRPVAELQRSAIERLFGDSGAALTQLTAEQHDRITSHLQGTAHFLLLSLGRALGHQDPADLEVMFRLMTPVHGVLLSLLARVAAADPDLYQSIQTDNPFSAAARRLLIQTMVDLDSELRMGRPDSIRDAFAACARVLGDHSGKMLAAGKRIVRSLIEDG